MYQHGEGTITKSPNWSWFVKIKVLGRFYWSFVYLISASVPRLFANNLRRFSVANNNGAVSQALLPPLPR